MRRWFGDLAFMLLDAVDAAGEFLYRYVTWAALIWGLATLLGIGVGLGIVSAKAVIRIFGY